MIRSLNSRIVYMIGFPLLIALGAATTILAPMLLDAANFTRFALLNSLFTYLSEFDLGLARLSDRLLPRQTSDDAVASGGLLLFARYCVAGSLLLVGFAWISDPLMLLAGSAGIALLLANGPLSYYRARANTTAFVFAALLMQFGMTLPRLIGLLIDGVRGSMIGYRDMVRRSLHHSQCAHGLHHTMPIRGASQADGACRPAVSLQYGVAALSVRQSLVFMVAVEFGWRRRTVRVRRKPYSRGGRHRYVFVTTLLPSPPRDAESISIGT